jgi:hypothetical protein
MTHYSILDVKDSCSRLGIIADASRGVLYIGLKSYSLAWCLMFAPGQKEK